MTERKCMNENLNCPKAITSTGIIGTCCVAQEWCPKQLPQDLYPVKKEYVDFEYIHNLEAQLSKALTLNDERLMKIESKPKELKIGGYQELALRIQEQNKRIGELEHKVGSNIKLHDLLRRVEKLEALLPQARAFFTAYNGCGDEGYTIKDGTPIKHNVSVDCEHELDLNKNGLLVCNKCGRCPALERKEVNPSDKITISRAKAKAFCTQFGFTANTFIDEMTTELKKALEQ